MKLNRNNIRLLRFLFILILALWGSIGIIKNKPWTSDNETVKVLKVKDGDSIVVTTSKGQKDLRIWGIDAPEKGQPYANTSKKLLEELVLNKHVRIQSPKTDKFNRDLAFISVTNSSNPKGLDVGSILISRGLAWHFNPDPKHDKPYKDLETKARNKKMGIWSEINPKSPEDFRREQKNESPKTFKL